MQTTRRILLLLFVAISISACQAIKEGLRQEEMELVNLTLQKGVMATEPNIISPKQDVYGMMTPKAVDGYIVYAPEYGTEAIINLPRARKIAKIVLKFQQDSIPKSYSICYSKENGYAWTRFRMEERVPPNGVSILHISPIIIADKIKIRAPYVFERLYAEQ